MSENERFDTWTFDFADLVVLKVRKQFRALAVEGPFGMDKIEDAVREAVLEALHEAPKQEICQ
jgi:hypothetical protein